MPFMNSSDQTLLFYQDWGRGNSISHRRSMTQAGGSHEIGYGTTRSMGIRVSGWLPGASSKRSRS